MGRVSLLLSVSLSVPGLVVAAEFVGAGLSSIPTHLPHLDIHLLDPCSVDREKERRKLSWERREDEAFRLSFSLPFPPSSLFRRTGYFSSTCI